MRIRVHKSRWLPWYWNLKQLPNEQPSPPQAQVSGARARSLIIPSHRNTVQYLYWYPSDWSGCCCSSSSPTEIFSEAKRQADRKPLKIQRIRVPSHTWQGKKALELSGSKILGGRLEGNLLANHLSQLPLVRITSVKVSFVHNTELLYGIGKIKVNVHWILNHLLINSCFDFCFRWEVFFSKELFTLGYCTCILTITGTTLKFKTTFYLALLNFLVLRSFRPFNVLYCCFLFLLTFH